MDDHEVLLALEGALPELALALGDQWPAFRSKIADILAQAVAAEDGAIRKLIDRLMDLLLTSPASDLCRELLHAPLQDWVRGNMALKSTRPSTMPHAARSTAAAIATMDDPNASLALLRARTAPPGVELESASNATPVDCAIFAPPSVEVGGRALVQVFVYPPASEDDAATRATEADPDAARRAFQTLSIDLSPGTRLDIRLDVPGLHVDGADAFLTWRGRANVAQFSVEAPVDTPTGVVVGTVRVAVAGVPVGTLRFRIDVSTEPSRAAAPRDASVRGYRKAFISYSSQDRAEVLKRVQMLKILGITFFQDVLSLEPGDRWARKLYRTIDECDVFYLFWSTHSKASEWVGREVDYAVGLKKGDEDRPPDIVPIPVEQPIPSPPESLAHLHFNDALLAHIYVAEHT
jgi:hypothetical protein